MAGRPRARTFIVPPQDLVEDDALLLGGWTLLRLIPIIDNNPLEWLAKHRLIANSMNCPLCGALSTCTLNRYAADVDRWRWRCNLHNFTQSVREGSFFSGSKLTLPRLIMCIYLWAPDTAATILYKKKFENNFRRYSIRLPPSGNLIMT